MKPARWDKMHPADRVQYAASMLDNMRGQLIMGQALARAVVAMETDPYPETSNIQDMEAIGEALFDPFFSMYREREKNRK